MKNYILSTIFALVSMISFAQTSAQAQPEKVTKYVTTFPNGEEAITIVESSKTDNLKLSSAENFYKYEILEPANHELVHHATNRGKVCEIDKTKLEDGTYTLKVYTSDFVITSDITISNMKEEEVLGAIN